MNEPFYGYLLQSVVRMFGGHCLAADSRSMQRPLASFHMGRFIGSSKAACSGTRRCHVGSHLHLHLGNLTGECKYGTVPDEIKCSCDNLFAQCWGYVTGSPEPYL
jgi:hypothetical protein